jgi:nucleotide-binding universal stress UspA family protein
MRRLLVPLDGSALAEAILPITEALARGHDAEVLLVRVAVAADAVEAEAYLARLARTLGERGLPAVRWRVEEGEAAAAIAAAARALGADLVTMTSHGRSGLGRLLVGSVARAVVEASPVPVLVVRGQPAWWPGQSSRVLVPLDGSDLSSEILPVVERLGGPLDLIIHLVHVLEPMPGRTAGESSVENDRWGRREAEAEAYLERYAARLESEGLRVQRAVREGVPAEVLSKYVEDEEIRLVAMTTRGRSGLGRVLVGSVAERVLDAVAVPVILWQPRR